MAVVVKVKGRGHAGVYALAAPRVMHRESSQPETGSLSASKKTTCAFPGRERTRNEDGEDL
jgi:hypothetical protein